MFDETSCFVNCFGFCLIDLAMKCSEIHSKRGYFEANSNLKELVSIVQDLPFVVETHLLAPLFRLDQESD